MGLTIEASGREPGLARLHHLTGNEPRRSDEAWFKWWQERAFERIEGGFEVGDMGDWDQGRLLDGKDFYYLPYHLANQGYLTGAKVVEFIEEVGRRYVEPVSRLGDGGEWDGSKFRSACDEVVHLKDGLGVLIHERNRVYKYEDPRIIGSFIDQFRRLIELAPEDRYDIHDHALQWIWAVTQANDNATGEDLRKAIRVYRSYISRFSEVEDMGVQRVVAEAEDCLRWASRRLRRRPAHRVKWI